MILFFKKKNLLNSIVVLSVFLVGFFLSLNSGISYDEFHEKKNWEINSNVIKSLGNSNFKKNYSKLENYEDKFHGVGFHYIAKPLQYILEKAILSSFYFSKEHRSYVSAHPIIFLLYLLSLITFYKISSFFIKEKNLLYLSSGFYILCPYLLGHSFFNLKDIPFMCFWIFSFYFNIVFFKKFFLEHYFSNKYFFLFLLSLSFLISVRLSGLLYALNFIFLFYFFYEKNFENFIKKIKLYKVNIFFGIIFFIFLLYILNPVYWKNPLLLFYGISWLSDYFNNVSTLTNGEIIRAKNIPITYIPSWLLVKLPIVTLVGIFISYFVIDKIEKQNISRAIFYSTICTVFSIFVLSFLLSFNLYDEIRHLLFFFPLLIIFSLISIYNFNKFFYKIILIISILFFFIDNIKIYPYNYSWFNLPSRFFNLSNNYEIDYWETANKQLNNFLVDSKQIDKKNCVFGGRYDYVFLKENGFNCTYLFNNHNSDNLNQITVLQYGRNLRKKVKTSCKQIKVFNFSLVFSREKFDIGKVFVCS